MKKLGGLDKLNGRFALLRHVVPPGYEAPSHWDLMLENGSVLLTFQLLELPSGERQSPMLALDAKRLPDHRRRYLDYEGPIEPLRSDSNVVITNDSPAGLKTPPVSDQPTTDAAFDDLRHAVPSGRGYVTRLAGGSYQAERHSSEELQTVRFISENLQAVIRIPDCEVGATTRLGIVEWQLDVGSADAH